MKRMWWNQLPRQHSRPVNCWGISSHHIQWPCRGKQWPGLGKQHPGSHQWHTQCGSKAILQAGTHRRGRSSCAKVASTPTSWHVLWLCQFLESPPIPEWCSCWICPKAVELDTSSSQPLPTPSKGQCQHQPHTTDGAWNCCLPESPPTAAQPPSLALET